MPLYPEFPQGVLSPGYMDIAAPPAPRRQLPPKNMGATAPRVMDGSQIAAAMGPQALPETERPGFFGRIREQPGGSRALLAMGASLLSSQNFFEGLGQGAMAYQGVLDEEQAKLDPTPVGDGSFTSRRDPRTGALVFERTAIGDFEEAQNILKLRNAELIAGIRDRGDTERLETTMGYRDGWERRDDDRADRELDLKDEWNKDDNATSISVAEINAAAAEQRARITAAQASGRPPSGVALRTFEEHQNKVNVANGTLSEGARIVDYLTNGELDLGFFSNTRANISQVTGVGSNENTRRYGELQQFTQSLVNTILIDAAGVQTDGDAARARIMSLVSSGDSEGAAREISTVMRSIERGRDYSNGRADDISRQFGIETTSTDGAVARGPAPSRSAPAARRAAPSVSNW